MDMKNWNFWIYIQILYLVQKKDIYPYPISSIWIYIPDIYPMDIYPTHSCDISILTPFRLCRATFIQCRSIAEEGETQKYQASKSNSKFFPEEILSALEMQISRQTRVYS